MPRFPLARMMLGNATLLSVVYLACGLALEMLSRYLEAGWARRLGTALDSLPLGALQKTHVLAWVQAAYDRELISRFGVRIVLGVTTVAIIFATAFLVGACMWAVRAWVERGNKARA